mmetsp:Transcript_7022/g.14954  ORF Transcript_7022/g.14954 Transcript_7022/m.14954 type:complete len:379 (+) Transcript_7022:44-1180(+)
MLAFLAGSGTSLGRKAVCTAACSNSPECRDTVQPAINNEEQCGLWSRRSVVRTIAGCASLTVGRLSDRDRNALAEVFFDIDRYGDKEMKVSAINKVKQNLRNMLAENPELLASVMAIGVHDGLGFSTATRTGGPNGSLRFEADRPCNQLLGDALDKVNNLRERLKDVSLADHYAFCGAVALELVGGPRIVVQLGREDASKADPLENESSLDGLRGDSNAEQMKLVFERAGLPGAQSAVLFHGAYGILNAIGKQKAEALDAERAALAEDEAFEDADVTYGRVDKNRGRGAVLVETNVATLTLKGAKFDSEYLKQLIALEKSGKTSSLSPKDIVLLQDPELRSFVEKYAASSKQFVRDFAQLYEACTMLGAKYENSRFRD